MPASPTVQVGHTHPPAVGASAASPMPQFLQRPGTWTGVLCLSVLILLCGWALVSFDVRWPGGDMRSSTPLRHSTGEAHGATPRPAASSRGPSSRGRGPHDGVAAGAKNSVREFFDSAGAFRCPQPQRYTREEVARHNTADDLWMVIDGNVLDLSLFIDQHPGGHVLLDGAGGQDMATLFARFHHPPTWTNLAQIGFCTPAHHHYPASTMEVQQAIAFVRACKGKCRVAGAGKSPNSSTFTSEHLIHMNRMNRILSIDADTCTLTCEAGALMEDVMNVLDKEGLMLRCVPSYVRTTVGGCIATATHSSGITCHSLSDYVRELKVVDGRGEVKTLGPAAGKELRLAACHLGALGVVTEIKLEVQPRVQWRLENNPLSMADANDAALVARKVRENEYYRWWWVPHTDGCYESYGNAHCEAAGSLAAPKVNKKELEMKADPKARVTPKRPLPDGEPPKNGGLGAQYPDETKPGSVAVEASAAAAPVDRSNAQSNCHNGFAVGAAPVMSALTNWISNELIRHQLVEWSLWVACRFPSLQPHINRAYQRMFYTTPAVLRGSALHCFTFDCLFRQWANEWAIDASRAVEAFQKIRSMIDREQMLLHFPVEFRFSAADDSDMSPAFGRKTCWIGVVMYRPRGQEARDTRRAYDGFNKLMEEMQGRPHWAKYYNWGHREVSAAYGNGWDRFLELRRKMDPDDMFLNAWLSNLMSPDRVNSTDFKGK